MRTPFRILHLKALAALLLAAFSAASCKKLITIPPNPPAQIPTSQVFVDSVDIMGAIAGVYGNFKVAGGGLTITSGMITQCTGLSSDELSYNNASDLTTLQFPTNGLVATNTSLQAMWASAYAAVYPVNASLQGISKTMGISDSLKRQLTGELRVIRAFYYFQMVNLFGGVPLVDTTDFNITASQPRASVDSVYGQIIADLTSARQLLKAAYPSAGRARVNLYTADALLAKVYLYRGQWAAAANLASEVIGSGQYNLVSDLTKVYLDGSKEAIWQLPANGFSGQTTEGFTFIPSPYVISVPNNTITDTLLHAFETGDARRTSWIAPITVRGKTYYYPFKYKNRVLAAPTSEDYMMLRLGEVYLIRAEALANQNKTDSALADMNQLRVRAGLAAIANTAITSQADLMKAVAHERQIELFCEWGNRWYDLKRTATIDAVLGQEKPGWVSFYALYPIPFSELTLNPFLIQNPGY